MLASIGYSTDIANNGSEAIQKLYSNTYRVILMDGHMPVMDGIAATLEIRRLECLGELNHQSPVPIVALTANACTEARDEFIAAGMNDYLTKPLTIDRLQAALLKFAPVNSDCTAASASGD